MIKWEELWKKRIDALNKSRGADACGMWKTTEKAKKYAKRSSDENNERIKNTLKCLEVNKNSRILDIGSGPGNIAIPLSFKAKSVTAVEPADGMQLYLENEINSKGISNISVVKKRWEEVDIINDLDAPYDIVFSSFSFGGIKEFKSSINKMLESASEKVYIFWMQGGSAWINIHNLLSGIKKEESCDYTEHFDLIYNMLYEMKIFPDVKVFKSNIRHVYSDLNEAAESYSYPLEKAGNRKQIAEKILKEKLNLINEGYTIEEESRYACYCIDKNKI